MNEFITGIMSMKHLEVDFLKLHTVKCKYHRIYNTSPYHTLLVSIDGVKKEYTVRKRTSKLDKIYHSRGIDCILVVYDDIVLSFELLDRDHKDGELTNSERNVHLIHQNYRNDKTWYFDSVKFYQLDGLIKPSDNFVSEQTCNLIDPVHLTYSTFDVVKSSVFVITHKGNVLVCSTPFTKSYKFAKYHSILLDSEQEQYYLNLTTLLAICDTVSKLYGQEEIEKFDIPQYMIRHQTINICRLSVYIKDNSSTYVKPVEAISYVMSLLYREDNHDSIVKLSKLLKMIVRTGFIDINSNDVSRVYKSGTTDIPLIEMAL